MLEHYLSCLRVLRRLRGGGLGEELDHISACLFEDGYRRASGNVNLSLLGRFGRRMSRAHWHSAPPSQSPPRKRRPTEQ